MTVRARGTSFGNRQECLGFIKQFRPDNLSVTLEKEPGNKFHSNAIRIVVHIHPISKKTIIGYVPKGLARELSLIDIMHDGLDDVEEAQVDLAYLAGLADCLLILDQLELFRL